MAIRFKSEEHLRGQVELAMQKLTTNDRYNQRYSVASVQRLLQQQGFIAGLDRVASVVYAIQEEERDEEEITASLGLYPVDIRESLQQQDIEATPENVNKVAQHLRRIAAAWAQAQLQDVKDWREWIDG